MGGGVGRPEDTTFRKREKEVEQLSQDKLEINHTMKQINTQTSSSSSSFGVLLLPLNALATKVLASNQSRHRFSIFVY